MTKKLDRLHLVLTFLAVAQHGNLSAAAKALGTTQPTVSRRLRDLEMLLGTRLAARTTHRFHLTPEGIELQRRAMVWADEWSEWEHDLKTTTSVPRGVLTIVGPHAYGSSFLMEAIAQYRVAYPQVQVRLRLTVASGVDLGTNKAVHSRESKPETPNSFSVGVSGKSWARLAPLTARTRSLPACECWATSRIG